jgi:hypothetical protein
MKRLSAWGASAALAVASMGAATGSAQAGSENWGSNGFGACTSLGNSTFSDQSSGACVQSLSGWVNVKPWTIFYATPTCEDTLDGPYPVSTLYPGLADADYPIYVFSGQAWYAGAEMNEWVDDTAYGEIGIAWQGSGIDSDLAKDHEVFFGKWDGDAAQSVNWGTGMMAFGNPDLFSSKTAQYALACLEAQVFGVEPYGTYSRSTSAAAFGSPVLRYSHNPSPAERKGVIPRSGDSDTHVLVWHRITVKPYDTRKVTLRCASGYERSGLLQLTDEHAPADMKAPSASEIKKNQVKVKSQKHQPKQARFTIKSKKLSMTTMVHAHLPCSKMAPQ